MCTLADSALTEKSSVKVCDTFKVNILLVSPNKKWITAGTKDSDDLSPKVFLVVFDSLSTICFPYPGLFSNVFFDRVTSVQRTHWENECSQIRTVKH